VGHYFDVLNNNLITRVFLLSKGTFANIDVDLPGAAPGSTIPNGINPEGDIVGSYNDTVGNFHGFLLSK
jgi:hypothetical protein